MITPYMILSCIRQNFENLFAGIALKKIENLRFCLLLFGELVEDIDAMSFLSSSYSEPAM